ncbi:MAG: tRNA threonylcarbamoyladenosine biosynthesis protein RimN [Thiobacillus sp. 65-29]|nr:MAG: tRNA threonylcarbamoyladenosine biosynthesis protein RimN [Thiobacillus sp. 65-29]
MRGEAAELRAYLTRGGLIAYPTESCYGLGCDPRNKRALKRLIALKGRDAGKGLLLIADHFRRLRRFVAALPPADLARMKRSWPGPVTWVVPASTACPPLLTGGRSTIAVRVTAHPVAARLCRMLGMALVSTSANKSGQKPARTAAQCRRAFGARVRVIEGRIGARKRPSTLIDLASGTVLRP